MVAPIDATAAFETDGETITLAMNYRTIALAEDERADCVTAFGRGKPTLSGLAALVWGFARPAHPGLTIDEAFAIVMRDGAAAGEALAACFRSATKGAEAAGDATARPPRGKTKG